MLEYLLPVEVGLGLISIIRLGIFAAVAVVIKG
jgi:hypothetical protein